MTVGKMKKMLENMPDDVEVSIQTSNGLMEVRTMKYNEEYVYCTTFRHVILDTE